MKTVAIVACSNAQKEEYRSQNEELVRYLEETGHKVLWSNDIYEKNAAFSGTGAERAAELMRFFNDPEVEEIYDISGGDLANQVLDGLDCTDIPRLTVYNKCDKPNTLSFDPDILLTSAKTGYGLDKLLQKLDEVLSDRVHTIRVLLPYDKLGLAAPMRERGSVQVEEYREDGLYLEGIVKTEDLHCFEGYLV